MSVPSLRTHSEQDASHVRRGKVGSVRIVSRQDGVDLKANGTSSEGTLIGRAPELPPVLDPIDFLNKVCIGTRLSIKSSVRRTDGGGRTPGRCERARGQTLKPVMQG